MTRSLSVGEQIAKLNTNVIGPSARRSRLTLLFSQQRIDLHLHLRYPAELQLEFATVRSRHFFDVSQPPQNFQ
jgi:hypothetical protein